MSDTPRLSVEERRRRGLEAMYRICDEECEKHLATLRKAIAERVESECGEYMTFAPAERDTYSAYSGPRPVQGVGYKRDCSVWRNKMVLPLGDFDIDVKE